MNFVQILSDIEFSDQKNFMRLILMLEVKMDKLRE